MARRHFLLAALVLAGSAGCERGVAVDPCAGLTVTKNEVSSRIPTVGAVEWSLAGGAPSSARIVYRLKNPPPSILNQGGEAPVDLGKPNYRTLLLGLKPSSDYTFHVEATRNGQTCSSAEYALPTTGRFANARPVGVKVTQAEKREPGFIVTSSGSSLPASAFIIDADGDVVWWAEGPLNPTRAQMDYEGDVLWMLSLNITNQGGEMRYLSMDGEREEHDVPGLETTHHDFTVMPGGKIAALSWRIPGNDPESELVIRSPDGSITVPFTIGNNLYRSDTFHANAIHYVPSDQGFTIADRNPNVVVKVSATGAPEWQLGGSCDAAPVGNRCSPRDWEVIHGHHLLDDGTLVVFNNTYAQLSHVFELRLSSDPVTFAAALVEDYTGTASSFNLGDVQRLPGGNTLVTYSTDGQIVELDPGWNEVQTFSVRVGYATWRPTLYGPPPRP